MRTGIALLLSLVIAIPSATFAAFSRDKAAAANIHELERPPYAEGELIVRYKDGDVSRRTRGSVSSMAIKSAVGIEMKVKRQLSADTVILQADTKSTAELLAEAKKDPNVEFAQPNYYFYAHGYEWNVGEEGGYSSGLNALPVWDSYTGSGIVVAVLDSGVDLDHPELVDNVWVNPGEIGLDDNGNDKRFNGIDDDNNGFPDDWRGWDFIGPNINTPTEDNDPDDGDGHGTHVAGIVGAEQGIDITIDGVLTDIIGVAPDVRIMPVKVLDDNPSGNGASGDIFAVTQGIQYAVDNGADVISMSFGTANEANLIDPEQGDIVYQALKAAYEAGVILVSSAGNSGASGVSTRNYPSSYTEVIAVGASDINDARVCFSNIGSYLELMAPGAKSWDCNDSQSRFGIISTHTDAGYKSIGGTSMAAPHVSGLIALLLQQDSNRTPAQVREILQKSTTDLGDVGKDDYYGYGLADAYAALFPPKIEIVEQIPETTNDNTPSMKITSTEAGTIAYTGSCSSATTTAIDGETIIEFDELADNTYSDCSLTVTDALTNTSDSLAIPDFTVDTSGETPTPTPSPSVSPSPSPSISPTVSPSVSPTATPTPTLSPSPSVSPSISPTVSPSVSPSPSASPTTAPSTSPSATPSPSATATPTPTPPAPINGNIAGSTDNGVTQIAMSFETAEAAFCRFDERNKKIEFSDMEHMFEATDETKKVHSAIVTIIGAVTTETTFAYYIRCSSDAVGENAETESKWLTTTITPLSTTPSPSPSPSPTPTSIPSSGGGNSGGGGGGGGGGSTTACEKPVFNEIIPAKSVTVPSLTQISFTASENALEESLAIILNDKKIAHKAELVDGLWKVSAKVPPDAMVDGKSTITLSGYIKEKCPRNFVYTVTVDKNSERKQRTELVPRTDIPAVRAQSGDSAPIGGPAGNLFSDEDADIFSDIGEHWSKGFVLALVAKEVIGGYGDGTFGPDNPLTRAEAVKIALEAFDYEIPETIDELPYTDVELIAWYARYLQVAKETGIVSGFEDGSFKPDNQVSRAEALKIIALAAGIDLSKISFGDSKYDDVEKNAWYFKHVMWANNNNIVSGFEDGTFAPNNPVTRAEFSKITYLMLQLLGEY